MSDENTERLAQKSLDAERAGEAVRALLMDLAGDMSIDAVLAGAHAEIISNMTWWLGGPATADACRRAIERVQNMPSAAAVALAVMPPAGEA
jgi:hypothetical protein